MRRTKTIVSAVAVFAVPGPLAAQDSLVPGIHVRITAPSFGADHRVGTLTSVRGDSLYVRFETGDVNAIPRAELTGLEVRTGSRAEFVGEIGAIAGIVPGVAVATSLYHGQPCRSPGWGPCWSADEIGKGLVAFVAGLSAGAILGYAIGSLIGSQLPCWGPAPGFAVKPSITLTRGQPGIGLSLAF